MNKLKEIRTERRISQEELAALCGISPSIIGKIESNEEVNLNTRCVAKMAEVLGTKPSEIFIA